MAYLETELYNEVSAQRKLSIVSWHTWKLNYTMRCPHSGKKSGKKGKKKKKEKDLTSDRLVQRSNSHFFLHNFPWEFVGQEVLCF